MKLANPLWPVVLLICHASSAQIITTVAGTDYSFPSGSLAAVNAPLGVLTGVAVDTAGNVYVADPLNSLVLRISVDGTLNAVAGNGIKGFSGEGGPATSASLNYPIGVAVDSAGNLYIADSDNYRIRRVSGGTITTVAGNGTRGFSGDGGPATAASLNMVFGLAVDSADNLYIADTDNFRVRKVSGGIITTVAGNGSSGFSGDGGPATSAWLEGPEGVAVDLTGNLYIADPSNQRVRKVSNGIITTAAGNGNPGFSGDGGPATGASLSDPVGVSVDAAGNLYIADTRNGRIREMSYGTSTTGTSTTGTSTTGTSTTGTSTTGTITTVAGNGNAALSGDGGPATSASLNLPQAVAVDSAGNAYIADSDNYRLRKVSGGTIATIAGNGNYRSSGDGGPATSASLFSPNAVAVDSAVNLYISDYDNQRIRKVFYGTITTATISTLAGNGIRGFSGNGGPATSASLNFPGGVAVDSAGNVYIADTINQRIRKVSNGIITTVAGNGTRAFSGDGGPATSASLNYPNGMAVDSAGNLYIADYSNSRIRKVSAGTITTVAGNGAFGFSGDGGPATSASFNLPVTCPVEWLWTQPAISTSPIPATTASGWCRTGRSPRLPETELRASPAMEGLPGARRFRRTCRDWPSIRRATSTSPTHKTTGSAKFWFILPSSTARWGQARVLYRCRRRVAASRLMPP
jgi:trimeric autotransporter adhesin